MYLLWHALRDLYWASSFLMFMGSLFIWCNIISHLNNSVIGLGRPASMGIDLICNRARFTLLIVCRHFLWCIWKSLCMLYPDQCSGGDRMMFWSALCFFCKIAWTSMMWNFFLHLKQFPWSPNPTNTILAAFTRSSTVRQLFMIGNLL